MSVTIHSVKLILDRCYLLQGRKSILIDGGAPYQAQHFARALQEWAIQPQDIKLIVLTHAHWDHIGSAKAIKELTGAQLALHWQEKEWLEKSLTPMPPGVTPWGRILSGISSALLPLLHIPATNVDLVLSDEEVSLTDYGIPGKIIYTPGHSMGSVSILLDSGEAFVGDLAMGEFPLRLRPGLPIFAEDMHKLKESWKLLIDQGAKTIYPAHAKPFSVDIIKRLYGMSV